MGMKRTIVLAAALAALIVAGCSGASNPLVGTWEATTSMQGMNVNLTQDIKADKTYTASMNMELPQNMGKVSAEMNGKWESKSKEEITMTLDGVTVKEAPEAVKSMVQSGMERDKGKPTTSKITWVSNDEMSMAGPNGENITFKRKK